MQMFSIMCMVNNMDLNLDLRSIRETVTKKNFYIRSIVLIVSIALLALNYNLFLSPNHFVIGGTSGLAIIINKLFGLAPSIFIGITSAILIVLALIFLGFKETSRCIIGSILYPFFISLTAPLANYLIPHLQFDSTIVVVLIAGILCGVSNGMIYKTGFNTGGSDILMKIMNKYGKMPEGKAVFSINIVIMIFGCIIFGANKFIYSLIILFINTMLIDRIIIGVSNSKLFFIYTKEEEKVKTFIMEELKTGVTLFNAKGGFSGEESLVLMCVVPNQDYYVFKETVLEIDKDAFFVINDCYEVTGGVQKTRKIIGSINGK